MELARITQGLADRITSGGAIPGKIITFDFGDDGAIRIDGNRIPPVVDNSAGAGADCRVKISITDFLDIAAGRQNPQTAYMTGKVRVEGDLGLAMQLGKILG